MYNKTLRIFTICVVVILALSACNIGTQPEATQTPTATAEPEFAPTATRIPTNTPTPVPALKVYSYSDDKILGPYTTWTLLSYKENTVIVGPNYRLDTPTVSRENQLKLVQLPAGSDEGDAWAAAADLFPNNNLYYSPLKISGKLPGTVKRGLPEGWSYFTAPLGSWTAVTANADWYEPTFVSLKGMLLDAKKNGTQPEVIWLDDAQFASFMITCEKDNTNYPKIMLDRRSVFQVFVNPGKTFNFAEVCLDGTMINGSGYVYTALRGDTKAEKEAWATEMANAYLELMFSRQDLNGNPSNQLYLDKEKGEASNFARIWIGDQRYAPLGFTPPLAQWVSNK